MHYSSEDESDNDSDDVSRGRPSPRLVSKYPLEEAYSGEASHWSEATYTPYTSQSDYLQLLPQDETYSSDAFFEVFSGRQKKASANSMTQISLLNDKVRSRIRL